MKDWYNNMTKEVATQRAKKLQERLIKNLGGKWKMRVHENMGWHFNVYLGNISVSQYDKNEYSCLLSGGDYQFTGEDIWSLEDNTTTTPEECIKNQLSEAKRVIDKLQKAVYTDTWQRMEHLQQ